MRTECIPLAGRPPRQMHLGDFTIWSKKWCCRWCRAKAPSISEIVHEEWCELVTWWKGENPALTAPPG